MKRRKKKHNCNSALHSPILFSNKNWIQFHLFDKVAGEVPSANLAFTRIHHHFNFGLIRRNCPRCNNEDDHKTTDQYRNTSSVHRATGAQPEIYVLYSIVCWTDTFIINNSTCWFVLPNVHNSEEGTNLNYSKEPKVSVQISKFFYGFVFLVLYNLYTNIFSQLDTWVFAVNHNNAQKRFILLKKKKKSWTAEGENALTQYQYL